jgi:hypothetical protein
MSWIRKIIIGVVLIFLVLDAMFFVALLGAPHFQGEDVRIAGFIAFILILIIIIVWLSAQKAEEK